MLLEDYIQLLEDPMSADEEAIEPLHDMLSYAPFCASAQLLLLRALYAEGQKKNIATQLQKALLYAPQDVSVYFLLRDNSRNTAGYNSTQDERQRATDEGQETKRETRNNKGEHSLSYFDMLEKLTATAKRTGLSFEELTKRYIETRKYTKRHA